MDFSKIKNVVKSASPLEIILFMIFTIYLVFPIETPQSLASSIDSPIGMIIIFIVTLYLFLYTNPVLGILYIFVAYELLRRSSSIVTGNAGHNAYIQYSPSQQRRDTDLKQMNPVKTETLEEDVVAKMAPIGHSDPATYVDTTFKPISENVHNAFSV